MTARKKGGASASQFVISMDDGEDGSEESHVVGRLKATTRTSEEFQVCFCWKAFLFCVHRVLFRFLFCARYCLFRRPCWDMKEETGVTFWFSCLGFISVHCSLCGVVLYKIIVCHVYPYTLVYVLFQLFLFSARLLFLLQVFSPTVSGAPDDRGVVREREVAAVHYSADKMDPHGRYDCRNTRKKERKCMSQK